MCVNLLLVKIVIRGDNNVGKSNLWLRLQGQPFKEVYETSDEIKVANIQWSYSKTDDIVKVEVWDVVDRSKKKKNLTGGGLVGGKLKTPKSNGFSDPYMLGGVEASLDAEFIDVYKNANGCIMVFDITKAWTWDYIERELPKVPSHLPVLVIGNFLDSQHHRAVEQLKCKYFIENLDRGNLASSVRYTETSMRSGFGLKYLHKFFNIPFLQLQRENLMQQLETNAKEMDQISEELTEHDDNTALDYEAFSDTLNSKRRQESELNAKDVLKNAKSLEEARKLAVKKQELEKARELAEATEPQKIINKALTTVLAKTGADKILSEAKPKEVSMSVTLDEAQLVAKTTSSKTKISNIQEFQVKTNEDELNQFLGSGGNMSGSSGVTGGQEEDEDEDRVVGGNPMVSGFRDTIDSEDERVPESSKSNHVNEKFLDLSDPEPEPGAGEEDADVVGQVAQFSALDFDFLESLNVQVRVAEDGVAVEKKKKKSGKKLVDEAEVKKVVKEKKVKKEKKKKRVKEMDDSEDEAGDGQVVKKDADYEEL